MSQTNCPAGRTTARRACPGPRPGPAGAGSGPEADQPIAYELTPKALAVLATSASTDGRNWCRICGGINVCHPWCGKPS